MANPKIKVTDLELAILQHIWESGARLTVSEILERWPEKTRPGYTTVLKTLQKMEAKDIVGHEAQGKKYAYFSRVSKEGVAAKRLSTIIDRMFAGDKISFAQYFIEKHAFNASELNELRALIDKKEQEEKP